MTVCEDLALTARDEMAAATSPWRNGIVVQLGRRIGHAGQIALGGIAVIALAACRELCVCAGRGGSTLGDFLGVGFSRQKLLSLGRCVIIIAVQRALKGIVLLVGVGNACIAFLCAFTLVQADFTDGRTSLVRPTVYSSYTGVTLMVLRPYGLLGSLALKPSGALLESIPSAASASELPVSAAAARISSRAAYAGDKSQCQSKAYAAFEFHGIFSFSYSAVRWNDRACRKETENCLRLS